MPNGSKNSLDRLKLELALVQMLTDSVRGAHFSILDSGARRVPRHSEHRKSARPRPSLCPHPVAMLVSFFCRTFCPTDDWHTAGLASNPSAETCEPYRLPQNRRPPNSR